jgi:Undecaprenyl-phosphate glucose phosphotransferase
MDKQQIDKTSLAGPEILEESLDVSPASQPVERRRWVRDKNWISPIVVTGATRLLDIVIVAAVGFHIWLVYVVDAISATQIYYVPALLLSGGLVPVVFHGLDLYSVTSLRSFMTSSLKVILGMAGIFSILTVAAFFTKLGPEFSRVWLASWFLTALFVLLAYRGILSLLVRRWNAQGRLERSAVVIGGGDNGAELIRALDASNDTDIRITGIFDDRSDDRSPRTVAGYRKLGNIDELVAFARKVRVDLLIVSFPITAETRLLEVLRKLWVLPVDIRLSAHTNKLRFRPRAYSYIGNVPFLDIFDKPMADWDNVIKVLEDRVISALALVLLSPVMALIALAVKLDSRGPVFFKQKRYGFNNELIEVYKFRSLFHEASDDKADKLVSKDDDRVTRVGRIIRKTSLDELPQFFNALKGELSLVGPRPHAMKAKAADKLYAEVVDGYFARHRVKPGITGWAQVNGWRGETDTAEKIERRVEYDLYYIENWSIMFDLYILLRTPFALFQTNSAY